SQSRGSTSPASHSRGDTTPSSNQSTTNTLPLSPSLTRTSPASAAILSDQLPAGTASSNHSSGSAAPSKNISDQSPASINQMPDNQSTVGSAASSQSPASYLLARTSLNESVGSAAPLSQSSASSVPNQSQASSAPSDQSWPSSASSAGWADGSSSWQRRGVNASSLVREAKEAARASLRRAPAEPCMTSCLNGGRCVQPESCDCSLYQAAGNRCQTVANGGFEREMACRTWAQYNFETFDGLYYYFPGRCSYTLLRDCEDAAASVLIQIHNDPNCGSAPYTCQRSVSLFLPWEGEVQLHATNVTFKGQSLQLPHHIHDVRLEQISHYVLVTQQHGFTLAWDAVSHSVYIKLSPERVGGACGLCGNFNADVQDDLKTSYGVLTQDVEMFGNSWMEAEPHQSLCAVVPPGFL
ncbi:hypothetical protein LDENG_00259030, partial [Lucifuga dentata]